MSTAKMRPRDERSFEIEVRRALPNAGRVEGGLVGNIWGRISGRMTLLGANWEEARSHWFVVEHYKNLRPRAKTCKATPHPPAIDTEAIGA